MRSNTTTSCASRRIAVEWLEPANGRPAVVALRKAGREFPFRLGRGGVLRRQGLLGIRRFGPSRAFTLLELMLVLGIIGFLAAMTLPHVGNFNRANAVTAATRQLVDDVQRARNRAIANRSTVYMVFVPPFWNLFQNLDKSGAGVELTPQLTNLLAHQYMSYALVSARTVGDQPGQSFPHYLTEWQTLPSGLYFWPGQFNAVAPTVLPTLVPFRATNTFNGTIDVEMVPPFSTNQFPFPSINAGTFLNLPCIGFTPQGTLVSAANQYIVLTRGSIFYPQDTNGNFIPTAPPNLSEVPPGNTMNNPCLIKIDALTARPTVVQNQFQ